MGADDLTPVDPVAQRQMIRCALEKARLARENEMVILGKLLDEGWDILIEEGGHWSATGPVRS